MNTAYTPIISYNAPPFGFEERPNPPDFSVCPEDPYAATENLKNEIKHMSRIGNNGNNGDLFSTKETFSYEAPETNYMILIFIILIIAYLLFN